MKSTTRTSTALLATAVLAFSGAVLASPDQCAHHGKSGHHAGNAHDGGERHERLAEMLDLDESQREAFDALRETRQAQREERRERKREMRLEMLGASAPEQLRLQAERMRSAADVMDERAEAMDEFYQTLDENQRRMFDRIKGAGAHGMKHDSKDGHSQGRGHGDDDRGGCSRH